MQFALQRGPDCGSRLAPGFAAEKIAPHANRRWTSEKNFPVRVMREAAALGHGQGHLYPRRCRRVALTRFGRGADLRALADGCRPCGLLRSHKCGLWMINAFGTRPAPPRLPKLCTMEISWLSYCPDRAHGQARTRGALRTVAVRDRRPLRCLNRRSSSSRVGRGGDLLCRDGADRRGGPGGRSRRLWWRPAHPLIARPNRAQNRLEHAASRPAP